MIPRTTARLATSPAVAGAMASFLALCIVPWVTADSDTRGWYGFPVVMSYSTPGSPVDVAGWVVGLVFSAAIAAIFLVLVALQSRMVSAGPRITAVISAVLATAGTKPAQE